MPRIFLIALLSLTTVGGFAAGFHSLHHHRDRREAFERHVADICTDAALRANASRAPSSGN